MTAPWAEAPDIDVDELVSMQEHGFEPHEPWRCDSTGEAEWCLSHVAAIDAELETIHAQRVEWQARLNDWEADAIRAPMGRRLFFVGALQDYARRLREADPKAKSLKLPSGTVTSRSRPEQVVVTDEAAVIAWAKESGLDVVQVKESIRLRDLRSAVDIHEGKAISPNGEVLPGVVVEGATVTFTVTPVRAEAGGVA
jgi:hypothetical protein